MIGKQRIEHKWRMLAQLMSYYTFISLLDIFLELRIKYRRVTLLVNTIIMKLDSIKNQRVPLITAIGSTTNFLEKKQINSKLLHFLYKQIHV